MAATNIQADLWTNNLTFHGKNCVQAQLKIDLSALGFNYSYFKNLGKNAEAAAVVKANGYGMGAIECAATLLEYGCNSFYVAHLSEAIALRGALMSTVQISVLNGVFENEVEYFKEYDVTPVLNSSGMIDIWHRHTRGQKCAIHIDTGMNRLGLDYREIDKDLEKIKSLEVETILSHLSCASDISHPMNAQQLNIFRALCDYFPNSKKSLSASAGVMLGTEYHFDQTRIGIGLYGANPLESGISPVKPVAHLSAPILQIRNLMSNEPIGYGASFKTMSPCKVAIVALGYADGFLRSASNYGFGYYGKDKCPILGRVSMDLIAIDISNCNPTPEVGVQIEFLGANANIDEQALAMKTIPYEILTRLGNRFNIEYYIQ